MSMNRPHICAGKKIKTTAEVDADAALRFYNVAKQLGPRPGGDKNEGSGLDIANAVRKCRKTRENADRNLVMSVQHMSKVNILNI